MNFPRDITERIYIEDGKVYTWVRDAPSAEGFVEIAIAQHEEGPQHLLILEIEEKAAKRLAEQLLEYFTEKKCKSS